MITSGFILDDLSVKQSQTPILLFPPVYCNILQKILSSKSKSPPPKKKNSTSASCKTSIEHTVPEGDDDG
jgi:hypothetical protein